jgi:hypothetical protein
MTTNSEINDVIAAIHVGDLATLRRLLADNPGLVRLDSAVLPKDARPCTWSPTGQATFQTV